MNELVRLSLMEKILRHILAFGMILFLPQGYLFALPGAQQRITGRVTDNSGNPLLGVKVVIKGISLEVFTDQELRDVLRYIFRKGFPRSVILK